MNFYPEGMNIEVTTKCPFGCPQCYCSLSGGKELPLPRAKEILDGAREAGISHVELSGGETMCYSHIYELIKYAADLGIVPSIAVSGWGIDDESVKKLVCAGVDTIYVSLNAPDEQRNKITREGYAYSIQALKVLKRNHFPETYINWVMHRDTADSFAEMVYLAEQYNAKGILIIEPKPNSKGELESYPSLTQMEQIAKDIKNYAGPVEIAIQHCFSALKIILGKSALLGNKNIGKYKGCTAGTVSMSVNVDGYFSPCRHLDYFEDWNSLLEYWENSPILHNIRSMKNSKTGRCIRCYYAPFCQPCLSYSNKKNNVLAFGNDHCSIFCEKQVKSPKN